MLNLESLCNGPGRIMSVADTPVAITADHNEVFYYWLASGLKDATLIHIDGHSDMLYATFPKDIIDKIQPDDYKYLTVAGFISAGVYCGIISEVYWLNPHSEERKLQDMGSTTKVDGIRLLNFFLVGRMNFIDPTTNKMKSADPRIKYIGLESLEHDFQDIKRIGSLFKGKIITPEHIELNADKPLILDIDYDAFCCDKEINNVPESYHGIAGYKNRLKETFQFLRGLEKRPDLITLTRSEGHKYNSVKRDDLKGGYSQNYTPEKYINLLEETIIRRLKVVYK